MNLLNSSVSSFFSGALGDLFDTVARSRTDRYITVFKEPVKNFVTNNQNVLAGYGEDINANDFTLTPVSGTFPAVIIYTKAEDSDALNTEILTASIQNKVRIKVEKDASDFISTDKTVNIIVDDQVFNVISQYKVQDYCGLRYFYYDLQQTS